MTPRSIYLSLAFATFTIAQTRPSASAVGPDTRLKIQSELSLAVLHGDLNRVRSLVAEGADISTVSVHGDPPLCYAAAQEKSDMLKLLLSLHARPDPIATLKVPLLYAIDYGRNENANLLIDAGANVNRIGNGVSGIKTPLVAATEKGLSDTVKRLIDRGAKADDRFLPYPLLFGAALSGDQATFQLIRQQHTQVPLQTRDGTTAFHFLAMTSSRDRAGLTGIVRALLAAGVDPHKSVVNPTGPFSRSMDRPLLVALYSGHSTIAEILLDEIEFEPAELNAGLHAACDPIIRSDVLRKMIHGGASVRDIAKAGGRTPLHRAVEYFVGDVEKLTLLLDAGHPIDPPTGIKNRTPLLTAVARSRLELVRLLLDRGADPSIKDADGNDAATLARLRIEKGRETGAGSSVSYRQDEGKAAAEGQRILDVLVTAPTPIIKK